MPKKKPPQNYTKEEIFLINLCLIMRKLMLGEVQSPDLLSGEPGLEPRPKSEAAANRTPVRQSGTDALGPLCVSENF